jgi:hypothetical protein
LKIHIYEAIGIPDMDGDGSIGKRNVKECDGYIVFEIMGTKLKTSVQKMLQSKSISWKESVYVINILNLVSNNLPNSFQQNKDGCLG